MGVTLGQHLSVWADRARCVADRGRSLHRRQHRQRRTGGATTTSRSAPAPPRCPRSTTCSRPPPPWPWSTTRRPSPRWCSSPSFRVRWRWPRWGASRQHWPGTSPPAREDRSVAVSSQIDQSLDQAASTQHATTTVVLIIEVQLVLIALLRSVLRLHPHRLRQEIRRTAGRARGYRPRSMLAVAMAEPMAIVVVTVPLGLLAAWSVASLSASLLPAGDRARRWTPPRWPPLWPQLRWPAWPWSSEPDAWYRRPSRPGHRSP